MAETDPQVNPDGNQEPERPEWLPENFKSPEAIVDAYKSSQSEMNRAIQREKQLEQQVEHYESLLTAQQNQPQQQQYDPTADPLIAGYEQAMENGDYRQALAYQAQISQAIAEKSVQAALPQVQQQYKSTAEAQAALVADHAWNNLRSRYGDSLEESRDKIAETIQANPWLIPEAAQRDPSVAATAIENVYKIVNPGAFVPGSGVDMTAAKLAAQGLPGAAGRPPSPDAMKAEWDSIKKAAENDPGRYW